MQVKGVQVDPLYLLFDSVASPINGPCFPRIWLQKIAAILPAGS